MGLNTFTGAIAGPFATVGWSKISEGGHRPPPQKGGRTREFLLAALALDFVVDDVFNFRVRLVAAQQATINEQCRRAADSISGTFFDVRQNGRGMLSGFQTLIEGRGVELQ